MATFDSMKNQADEIKALMAEHLKADYPDDEHALFGRISIVAEMFSPRDGSQLIMHFRDPDLPIWIEIGMLQTRIETLKEQWRRSETGI